MLICRSQGHLLFSDWTISQRTVSGRDLHPYSGLVQSFKLPCSGVTPVVWDGKSRCCFDICKWLLKNLFFRPPLNLTPLSSFQGRFQRDVFPNGAANVESEPFHFLQHTGYSEFFGAGLHQGVFTAFQRATPLPVATAYGPFRTNSTWAYAPIASAVTRGLNRRRKACPQQYLCPPPPRPAQLRPHPVFLGNSRPGNGPCTTNAVALLAL